MLIIHFIACVFLGSIGEQSQWLSDYLTCEIEWSACRQKIHAIAGADLAWQTFNQGFIRDPASVLQKGVGLDLHWQNNVHLISIIFSIYREACIHHRAKNMTVITGKPFGRITQKGDELQGSLYGMMQTYLESLSDDHLQLATIQREVGAFKIPISYKEQSRIIDSVGSEEVCVISFRQQYLLMHHQTDRKRSA